MNITTVITFNFIIYTLISVTFVRVAGAPINKSDNKQSYVQHTLFCILVFALLCTFYNVFVTISRDGMAMDRTNYANDFNNGTSSALSIGLQAVFAVIRFFHGSIYTVFYVTTFFYVAVSIWAFLASGLNSRYALAFFVLTDAIFFSFTALKQIYACAFATIFILYALKRNTVSHICICLATIALACLFHNAAIILIPTYPLLLIAKKKNLRGWYIFTVIGLLILSVLFMDKIASIIAKVMEPIKPSIAHKILGYFTTKANENRGSMTFVKGFPFYLIVAIGVFRRRRYQNRIVNYDALLLLSALGATLYFASIQSYWIFRATAFYFFPICLFIGQIASCVVQDILQKSSASPAEESKMSLFGKLKFRLISTWRFLLSGIRSIDFLLCSTVYISELIVMCRWLPLVYINYGGF